MENSRLVFEESQKRKREPSFVESEKDILLDLVKCSFHIIECKKTDSVSSKAKQIEWEKLVTSFNAISGFKERESKALKTCWENMKKRAKEDLTKMKQYQRGTGGGPPLAGSSTAEATPLNGKVLNRIGTRASPLGNTYDIDGKVRLLASETLSGSQEIISNESNIEMPVPVTSEANWVKYTPASLRTPKSVCLRENFVENIIEIVPETGDIEIVPDTDDIPIMVQTVNTADKENPTRTKDATEVHTPKRNGGVSRQNGRRPLLQKSEEARLAECRLKTLQSSLDNDNAEHAIKMEIMDLQKQQELLKVKQERIQLAILRKKFRKLK